MIRYLLLFLMIVSLSNCKRDVSDSEIVLENTSTEIYSRDRSTNRQRVTPKANAVKMTENGGVYTIPIEINNVGMDIIFDTGASSISISETEVFFLIKQGKITEEDFLGSMRFKDATGSISEGTRINLKKIKIGNREIQNVEASVVHNMAAPLLLGQSALSKFGKLTIDYKKNEIIFHD